MEIYFFCILMPYLILANVDFPQVTIEQGALKGSVRTSFNNRTFYSFTGIPYAKPPIGWYRFEPPQPFGKWDGIYNATGSHTRCLQFISTSRVKGGEDDEDCLYLNVYTPQLPLSGKQLLPVMFYIHGGAFFEGTAKYGTVGPQILMDKDLVLVTANYRLGPLGFFSTGDAIVPGNMGLKDQAFALKWVADNIIHFGGNSNSVTIFGHSAGGASAHLHMFSQLSKGLFHGVIAQSGTAFSRWALFPSKDIEDHSTTLADIVGCKRQTNRELVKCLKKLNETDLINGAVTLAERKRSHFYYFGPRVEADIADAFISKNPIDILKSGEAANVPLMTGLSSEDGSILVAYILGKTPARSNWEDYVQHTLPLVLWYSKLPDAAKENITNAIRNHYLDNNSSKSSAFERLKMICTHGTFLEPAYETIKVHSKYSDQVYYYLFEYQGSETYAKYYNMDYQFGVTHGDELLHLFNNSAKFPGYIPTKSDKKMIDLLSTLWFNFVKYGNPTPVEDQSLSVQWKPVKKDKEHYYHFKQDTTAESKEGLFTKEAQFWINLFDRKQI